MFSYILIFVGVVTISVSFPQGDFENIGFPNFDGDGQEQPIPPNFNNFPPFTSSPSTTTVNVPLQSTTAAPVTTRSPAFIQCLRNMCPTTNEYNPVCGTDNVSYDNHQKLNCANFCGPRVVQNWQPVARIRMGTCGAL